MPPSDVLTRGDLLGFAGSLLGAAAGVGAAFLAVWLAGRREEQAHLKTMRGLLARLQDASRDLSNKADTDPGGAARALFRAYMAAKDTAVGIRTEGANIATVASRLEYSTFFDEVIRLNNANGGIVVADSEARAKEGTQLSEELCGELARGL